MSKASELKDLLEQDKAVRTTVEAEHWHEYTVDAQGNGKTTDNGHANGTDNHSHSIELYKVASAGGTPHIHLLQ